MEEPEPNADRTGEQGKLLRAIGTGAIAVGLTGLLCTAGAAADAAYNRADLARVNELLRSSAGEREAFYANPQAYLERHGIRLPKEGIPSRSELEAALQAGGGLEPVAAEPALANRKPAAAEPALASRKPGTADPALASRAVVK